LKGETLQGIIALVAFEGINPSPSYNLFFANKNYGRDTTTLPLIRERAPGDVLSLVGAS